MSTPGERSSPSSPIDSRAMTTFAPSSHDAERHDLAAHAIAPSSDAMAINSDVNGFPSNQDATADFATGPVPQAVDDHPSRDPQPSTDAVAKPEPVGAAVDDPSHATSDSAPAAPTQDQPAVMPIPDVPATPVLADEAMLDAQDAPVSQSTETAPALPSMAQEPAESVNATSPAQPQVAPAPVVEDVIVSTADQSVSGVPPATQPSSNIDQEMTDAGANAKISRDREEDEHAGEPSAKRVRTDDIASSTALTDSTVGLPSAEPPAQAAPVAVAPPAAAPTVPATNGVQTYLAPEVPDFGPMTDLQRKRITDGIRNIKKSKHSNVFIKPVDAEAQNLPNYHNVIKEPMDISTMEQKLKDNVYHGVNDYIRDFDLMVQNAITFNTQSHPVAQAGQMLRSQLTSQLSKMPKPGDEPPPALPKKAQKASVPAARRDSARRNSRPSLGAAQSPVAPLHGQPIVRRNSSLGDRPKRKIQKPAPRDLSYAKPQKKKYQAELKFAEEVLEEMRRPRYLAFSQPFLEPVDPVALNIPDYYKIIKKPMDVSTVADKLGKHQYENFKEFENDFRQIFTNCYKFNPPGTAVHNLGKEFEQQFNMECAKKEARLAAIAPASAAQSPAADSDLEESEDDEAAEERERMAKIKALNEQVAFIQQQAAELMSSGWTKSKTTGKGKGAKGPGSKPRKSSGGAAAPAKEKKTKPKATLKKSKPLTASQKQEIADHIGELPTDEINRVADQIKASLRKAGKPVPPDDELEFQIDDIPDELLHELLVKVRKNAPSRAKDEDEEYNSPPAARGTAGQKTKKNKPMSKVEQEEQINRLEGQLATFQGGNGEGMFQEDGQDDDSSGSDNDSESEEE